LPQQRTFYPVLTEADATKIARDWSVKASRAGYVTRSAVWRSFWDRYQVLPLVAAAHGLLDPAKDLPEFNDNIAGLIEIISGF
jgi:hypothetical protein